MLERLLALRYIRVQKRHSILTICSIAIALALMTLLFTTYATIMGIRRDVSYDAQPYHVKVLRVTQEEYETLAACPEFKECRRVVEENYTISAELMIRTYHDNIGEFLSKVLPDKGLYSVQESEWNSNLAELNYELIVMDCIDLNGRYKAVTELALFYVLVIFVVMALRLIIDTAFEVSSKERERQFGVLQSIGATPGQIVRILTVEGLFLSVIGIPVGVLLGLGLSEAVFRTILSVGVEDVFCSPEKAEQFLHLQISSPERAQQLLHIHINPLLLAIGAVTGLVWVMLSAYGTGMRIIRMSPMDAITGRGTKVKRVRRSSLFGTLFGWEGRLAARNNRRQPKRFAITVVSLTLSIALFASFSVVIDEVQRGYERALKANEEEFDLVLGIRCRSDDPLSYRQGLEMIRESGYFDIVSFERTRLVTYQREDGQTCAGLVTYLPRETFDAMFEGEPPYSYDALTEQDAFILTAPLGSPEDSVPRQLRGIETLTVQYKSVRYITDAEYDAMSPEEQKDVKEYQNYNGETGEQEHVSWWTHDNLETSVPIAGFGEERIPEYGEKYEAPADFFYLVGTLDMYENGRCDMLGNLFPVMEEYRTEYIAVSLRKSEDYGAALQFLNLHTGLFSIETDRFVERQTIEMLIAAVRIAAGILILLIALIAVVNMVNILSTGILNRKSEFAALSCIGMTKGQLYRLIVVECLQYVLISGIAAMILTEGLQFGTWCFLREMMLGGELDGLISYAAPIPKILLAAAAAFVTALAASLVPLKRLERESLTDQIRGVE